MWSIDLRVFKTFIQYNNQSSKRCQVGNIGQFCTTRHHVCDKSYSVGPNLESSVKRDWGETEGARVLMKIANKRVISSVSVQMPSHWHSSVHLRVSVFERGVSLGLLIRSPWSRCLCVPTMCASLFKCQKYTAGEPAKFCYNMVLHEMCFLDLFFLYYNKR